jgi:hypothetical protein
MKIRTVSSVVLAAALVAGMSTAWAGKKEDFKAAVDAGKGAGCKNIPYSDLQRPCVDQGPTMHDWCDGRKGPVTCTPRSTSRNLTSTLEKEKQKLKDLQEKKSKAEDRKSRAPDDSEKSKAQSEIEAAEKEIYAQGKVIEQAEKDLKDRKELVTNAIYTIEKCIDYRRAVMNVFASAQDKVRNENEDDVKENARTLRDWFEESKRGHEIAITNKQDALSTCKDERL